MGTVLAERYRVIGLLGRGGMGEVYRADDLRLGQPVALKFLPDAVAGDAVRLAQFHNEVRIARQVSHRNVCRVYDIGEVDGRVFLSMEFVDGEDLATLLRRIGRLPQDKGVEIARQICAGLAAAHEHRRAASRSQAGQHHARRRRPCAHHRFRPGRARGRHQGRAVRARPPTWRPSSWRAEACRSGATSSRWASCSTKCSRASAPSTRRRLPSSCASTIAACRPHRPARFAISIPLSSASSSAACRPTRRVGRSPRLPCRRRSRVATRLRPRSPRARHPRPRWWPRPGATRRWPSGRALARWPSSRLRSPHHLRQHVHLARASHPARQARGGARGPRPRDRVDARVPGHTARHGQRVLLRVRLQPVGSRLAEGAGSVELARERSSADAALLASHEPAAARARCRPRPGRDRPTIRRSSSAA